MTVAINHKVLGILFICLLLAGVWLVYGVFSKKFVDYDRVTLETSTLGLQLPERADVKIRGVIVGEVLGFDSAPDGATVTLGLYPDEVATIPANVTGSIVPKTLFGEKYVALGVPAEPSPDHIRTGDTITRTQVSIEVEKVLNDLYPLLRAVRPADINVTLNAIATALEGRGEKIGRNVETVDAYLRRLNPQIPAIVDDLRLTAKVSTTYAAVMPQIARILRNTITTTGTLEGREDRLQQFFSDVARFSDDTRLFLDQNGDNIIRVGRLGAEQLRLLAKYAPEYPCLTGGIVNVGKRQAEAFRGFTLHIVLETLPNQPRGYTAADVPRLGEDRGPSCLHLPDPPWTQANPLPHQPDFDDGVDSPTGKGTSRVAPGFGPAVGRASGPVVGTGLGYAGGPAEDGLLTSLLAPGLGIPEADVPDLGVLLVGPMARGAEVGLR
jgi:phospholipid/cholesterol/gamma-HCH transport system substrate-binding protein